MKRIKNKVLLCILDGFGISDKKENNPISFANTPNLDNILENNPYSFLRTDGEAVGLPDGQMGNSEVGHSTIGSGRCIQQTIVRINNNFQDNSIKNSPAIQGILKNKKSNKVHLIGMYSDGGIHSSAKHLHKLIELFGKSKKEIMLHLFSDGRDVSPYSFSKDIKRLSSICSGFNVKLCTISGRYYGMDRDNRSDRTDEAFNAIFLGKSKSNFYIPESYDNFENQSSTIGVDLGGKSMSYNSGFISNLISALYKRKITDEFIAPTSLNDFNGIDEFDDILFFNFRSDRMVQIVNKFISSKANSITDTRYKKDILSDNLLNTEDSVITAKGNKPLEDHIPNISSAELEAKQPLNQDSDVASFLNFKGNIVTMTDYFNGSIEDDMVSVVIPPIRPKNVLGEIISQNNIRQFRIAETEKYAHVTYFFNSGREEPFDMEDRVLIPSPKVSTYDLKPEMSAELVASNLIDAIGSNKYGFAVVNFANCDMVGHTGNFNAAVKSVECIDAILGKLEEIALQNDWNLIITSDHGNIEDMIDSSGIIHTQHTLNPVYFIGIGNAFSGIKLENGSLCDIAPTILEIMNIDIPSDITGKSLIGKLK